MRPSRAISLFRRLRNLPGNHHHSRIESILYLPTPAQIHALPSHNGILTRNQNYSTTVSLSADESSVPPPVTVPIVFVEADGTEKEVQATVGKHLLDIAHDNDVELEGACGGELACSTCHLIFEQRIYDTLPAKEDDEDDMLDLAFEITDTSRLGCQVFVTEAMKGMRLQIPDDGF